MAGAKDALTQQLASLQDEDTRAEAASRLFALVNFYPEDYGVDAETFAQEYFRDFDFTIAGDPIAVEDDQVILEYEVTVPVMAEVLATLEEAQVAALAANDADYSDGYANAFFQDLCADSQWGHDSLTLNAAMQKDDDGSWVVYNETALAAGLLDGYDPRQIDGL